MQPDQPFIEGRIKVRGQQQSVINVQPFTIAGIFPRFGMASTQQRQLIHVSDCASSGPKRQQSLPEQFLPNTLADQGLTELPICCEVTKLHEELATNRERAATAEVRVAKAKG